MKYFLPVFLPNSYNGLIGSVTLANAVVMLTRRTEEISSSPTHLTTLTCPLTLYRSQTGLELADGRRSEG